MIYTVFELNNQTRQLLEDHWQGVLVTGEISNLAAPSSGHLYFSLKDERAQVRCAFFRGAQRGLTFKPEHGQQVLIQARVSLYEARGDYQLIVEDMQLAGDGALQMAFEKLKQKLAAEGLFDSQHKKPLPTLPNCIGVITSSTAAALHDILDALKRRFPAIPVILYPSQVQGKEAAPQLVKAIEIANQRQECDVIILARGGGSLEDLWPFNEEIVARAIFHSEIPIITGVGHETDFTIADFVADVRAPTPSTAAEHVTPNQQIWQRDLQALSQRLINSIKNRFSQWQFQLDQLTKRLRHPRDQLRDHAQLLDQFEQRLTTAMKFYLTNRQQQLSNLSRALNAVSPLNTLQRGYTLTTNNNDVIIRDANAVKIGDTIKTKLAQGELLSVVEKIETAL